MGMDAFVFLQLLGVVVAFPFGSYVLLRPFFALFQAATGQQRRSCVYQVRSCVVRQIVATEMATTVCVVCCPIMLLIFAANMGPSSSGRLVSFCCIRFLHSILLLFLLRGSMLMCAALANALLRWHRHGLLPPAIICDFDRSILLLLLLVFPHTRAVLVH